jgi:4-diphosphocytidyl-2C-methyl-D-erythritol kinase
VNLTLDVFAPRSDGFHDLDSVVMKFLPADELEVAWEHVPRRRRHHTDL